MIYVASREDLPDIVDMALEIPKVFSFDNFPEPNKQKVTEFIYNSWLKTPIFVDKDEDAGIIKGFVGVVIEPFWWSDSNVIKDYMFYIREEYRSDPKVINSLISSVRDFGKLNNLPVAVSFISSDRTETKRKIFKRKGFKEAGFIATYGI